MSGNVPIENSEAQSAARLVPLVFIVDDDPHVSGVLREIIQAGGYAAVVHSTAEAFVDDYRDEAPGCIVLDVQLPGMNGLELQQTLAARHILTPIIMLTGHASIQSAVQAMKAGAFNFVEKPACPAELQRQVRTAVESDIRRRRQTAERAEAMQRMSALSEREREVMNLLVDATTPKRIAAQLGISPKTVEFHRANLLVKLNLDSVSELIRFSLSHGLTP
ncbi:MAG TPA: response regulator [Pirellulales bacterium]|jgi:FixJ family two-component response regulator|nr:response regulator [Pirellulales bacterium]